jgi:hypothetical protein
VADHWLESQSSQIKDTIYHTQGKSANHFTTDAVFAVYKFPLIMNVTDLLLTQVI